MYTSVKIKKKKETKECLKRFVIYVNFENIFSLFSILSTKKKRKYVREKLEVNRRDLLKLLIVSKKKFKTART